MCRLNQSNASTNLLTLAFYRTGNKRHLHNSRLVLFEWNASGYWTAPSSQVQSWRMVAIFRGRQCCPPIGHREYFGGIKTKRRGQRKCQIVPFISPTKNIFFILFKEKRKQLRYRVHEKKLKKSGYSHWLPRTHLCLPVWSGTFSHTRSTCIFFVSWKKKKKRSRPPVAPAAAVSLHFLTSGFRAAHLILVKIKRTPGRFVPLSSRPLEAEN